MLQLPVRVCKGHWLRNDALLATPPLCHMQLEMHLECVTAETPKTETQTQKKRVKWSAPKSKDE